MLIYPLFKVPMQQVSSLPSMYIFISEIHCPKATIFDFGCFPFGVDRIVNAETYTGSVVNKGQQYYTSKKISSQCAVRYIL